MIRKNFDNYLRQVYISNMETHLGMLTATALREKLDVKKKSEISI
jgi:hypothetical protein